MTSQAPPFAGRRFCFRTSVDKSIKARKIGISCTTPSLAMQEVQ
jgi:hypothetical protein